ncbi:hypothetical protein CCP4SC76_7730014 [Gammaproteobacteria bacterium]
MSTREEVVQCAADLFPNRGIDEVMGYMDLYWTEPHEREQERVQLAVLKASEGVFDRLIRLLDVAKKDYRDVLVPTKSVSTMIRERLTGIGCILRKYHYCTQADYIESLLSLLDKSWNEFLPRLQGDEMWGAGVRLEN